MTMVLRQQRPQPWQIGAGVYDGLSARIAAQAGYEVLWLSSFSVSASRGIPDTNLVTSAEMASTCASISAVCDLPVIVDIDNGYGTAATAVRAATMLAAAGAAAVCIEDSTFPKRCSFYADDARSIEDVEVAASRVAALVRDVPELTVIARTEALVVGLGVEEALRRLHAYVEAGAQGVMAQVPHGAGEQLDRLLGSLDTEAIPVILTPTGVPDRSNADLGSQGVSIVIHANAAIRSVVANVTHVMAELSDPARPLDTVTALISSMEDVARAVDADEWLAREGR